MQEAAVKYHMRRSEQQIDDRSILDGILRQGKYATLSLCRKDEPYVVTLNYGYDSRAGALFFHCAKDGLKTDFVRQNPNVCATIIVDKGYVQSQCSHPYKSVVIRGRIDILVDPDEKRKAVDVLIEHLEEQPETMKAKMKLPERQSRFEAMNVWRLNIEEIAGKEGS